MFNRSHVGTLAAVALTAILPVGCNDRIEGPGPRLPAGTTVKVIENKVAPDAAQSAAEAGPCDDQAKRYVAALEAGRDKVLRVNFERYSQLRKQIEKGQGALPDDKFAGMKSEAVQLLAFMDGLTASPLDAKDDRHRADLTGPLFVGKMGCLKVLPGVLQLLSDGTALATDDNGRQFVIEGVDLTWIAKGEPASNLLGKVLEVTGLRFVEHEGKTITAHVLRPYDVAAAEACIKAMQAAAADAGTDEP